MTETVTTRDPGGARKPDQKILEGETADPAALPFKRFYSHNTLPLRRRMTIAALVMALPVVVFWSTIFYHYGFRDDYSIIREADEEPGKVFRVCTGYARPLYGVLLETTASWIERIDDLKWMRLAGAVSVGLVSGTAFFVFTEVGWGIGLSALLSATIGLLPAAQIISSWAICWPHGLAAVLGLLAFLLADRAIRTKTSWRQLAGMATASVILALGVLFYQQHSLFYFVGMGAAFVVFHDGSVGQRTGWVIRHCMVAAWGLGLALIVMFALIELNIAARTYQMQLESNPLGKLWWFVKGPLKNALGIVVLNDELGKNRFVHLVVLVITLSLLSAGTWSRWRLGGAMDAGLWLAVLILLAVLSYSVNLASMNWFVAYRHLWALTSVLLLFSVAGLKSLSGLWRRAGRIGAPAALSLLLIASVVLARDQAYELVALPQSEELAVIEEAAKRIDITRKPRVFIVISSRRNAPSAIRFADEFGSLSTDAEWVSAEMLEGIMKERFPDSGNVKKLYQLRCGDVLPPKQRYDVVIDLRNLKNMDLEEALDQLGREEGM
jgi:hypothetical protein